MHIYAIYITYHRGRKILTDVWWLVEGYECLRHITTDAAVVATPKIRNAVQVSCNRPSIERPQTRVDSIRDGRTTGNKLPGAPGTPAPATVLIVLPARRTKVRRRRHTALASGCDRLYRSGSGDAATTTVKPDAAESHPSKWLTSRNTANINNIIE